MFVTFLLVTFSYLCVYLPINNCHRIKNEKRPMFFKAMPAPLATLCKGSSAMWNGMLILSVKRLSRPRNNARRPLG